MSNIREEIALGVEHCLFKGHIMTSRYLKCIFYLAILLIGISYVIGSTIYSGADEGAHFDCINFIINNHKLPLTGCNTNSNELLEIGLPETVPRGSNHEAAQPPLYYLFAASVGSFFSDLYIRLMMIRFMGVLLLIVSFHYINKTYIYLANIKIFAKNDFLFYGICLLFMLSPQFLKIMIPLNNEHLTTPIVAMLMFYLSQPKMSVWKLSVLSGALVLTKLTTIYFVPFVFLVLIFKDNIKHALYYSILVLTLIFPFILFNYINYGAITGMEEHIKIVQPIVNQANIHYTLKNILEKFPVFITTIWYDGAAGIIILISILFSFRLKQALYTSPIILNILIIFCITLYTPIFLLSGRYMFMNLANFVLIFYYLISEIIKTSIDNIDPAFTIRS